LIFDPYAEQRRVNREAASIAKIRSRQGRIEALAQIPKDRREAVKIAVIKMMEKKPC